MPPQSVSSECNTKTKTCAEGVREGKEGSGQQSNIVAIKCEEEEGNVLEVVRRKSQNGEAALIEEKNTLLSAAPVQKHRTKKLQLLLAK